MDCLGFLSSTKILSFLIVTWYFFVFLDYLGFERHIMDFRAFEGCMQQERTSWTIYETLNMVNIVIFVKN